jgi:DNA-binding LacI/PurR family transcriptional regulator
MMKSLTVSAFIRLRRIHLVSTREVPRDRSRATIDDVARRAGVSTATVSRVINNIGPVAQKTRDIVLNAIADLDYRPRSAAQILARKKTNTIGLLFTAISGEFFFPLLSGIERAAQENSYNLLIYSTQTIEGDDTAFPLPIGEHNTDGVIVYVNSLSQEALNRFYQLGFPVVLIHQTPPDGIIIPSVTVENKDGARRIVDHLIEVHGLHRIAYLSGSIDQEDSHWREMGYRESLTSHDIQYDPALVSTGGFNREIAEAAVKKWLADGVGFDAIFAADDEMAIGVLTALDQAGLKVPEDIALVGFDDIYLARYLTPPLTTVRAPTEEVGREAIQLLIQQIQGQETDPVILLPTELIIRQSCGCN